MMNSTVAATTGYASSGGEKVRLQLYAQNLPHVSGGGLLGGRSADPFAVVTILANDPNEQPQILGKTEVIKNSYNPRWVTSFDLNYDFARNTRINVGIYDEEKPNKQVIMGSAMFEVGEVLGAKGNIKAKRLRKGGSIFVRITPAPTVQDHTLTLCFHGVQLKNVDGIFGKTDPFFELTSQIVASGGTSKSWQPVYRSKHIDNDLNPKWEPFTISTNTLCDSDFNKPIQFVLWDYDKKGRHTFMGSFETSVNGFLAQVNAPDSSAKLNHSFTVKKNGKDFGKITVVTAKVDGGTNNNQSDSNQNNASTIPPINTSFSSVVPMPPPPAAAVTSPNTYEIPFSESLNHPIPPPLPPSQPQSSPMKMAATTMSVANAFSNSLSSNSAYTNNDSPRPMQPLSTSLPPALQPTAYQPAAYQNYQQQQFTPLPPPMAPPQNRRKFTQYLAGGCELELSIAIDYTGSNGDPRIPGTLHYIYPDGTLNDYEKAITAVGSVIARYDSDQKFPVFGFGAKYGGVIQHCFQVGNAPELDGLSSVLQAYRQVFHTGLTMSGPTVFSEVIDYAAAAARSKQEESRRIGKQSYRILLILTDGAVTDMEQTKRSIRNASDAPLSIVIVGIGNADFTTMNFLDNFLDASFNGSTTPFGTRDICKFVEFSKYKDNRAALTAATLAEIPDQLVEYFHSKGIMPLPAISGSQFSLSGCEQEDADDHDIDLNVNINPDGEISLANYHGAQYDDTRFDSYNSYIPPPANSPPYQNYNNNGPPYQESYSMSAQPSIRPSAPSSNSYGNIPTQQQQSQPSQWNVMSSSSPYNSYNNNQQPSTYNLHASTGSYNQGFQQASPPRQYHQQQQQQQQERIFYVQIPPNTSPGMQLKITNPFTKQDMIVTIPQGVAPGGKFGVRG